MSAFAAAIDSGALLPGIEEIKLERNPGSDAPVQQALKRRRG